MSKNLWQQWVIWGAAVIGMLSFAGTFPVTRALLPYFSAMQLGAGRVVIAGIIAGAVLVAARAPRPAADTWKWYGIAALGVGVGFPVLSAQALITLEASSAAVLAGVIPILTGLAAMLLAGERPGLRFWLACGAGCSAVIVFAALDAELAWSNGNSLFFVAMVCAALGYTAGGRLSRAIPSWQVTCWLIVLASPVSAILLLVDFGRNEFVSPGWMPWIGLLYLAMFSQLTGFVCWNFALAQGGIARVGQLQLLQPFVTMAIASLWLAESLSLAALVTVAVVILSLIAARRAKYKPLLIQEKAL